VLLVGGTGYLGSLIGAALLTQTQDLVVLAARPGHERDDIVARLRMEMTAAGDAAGAALERLKLVRLPDPGDRRGYASLFRENRIDEVINCAGTVHYFDVALLKLSNIDLVSDLLAAAKEASVRRFTHVSTAFACGHLDGVAREALFDEPASDPTEYTRYKRRAEHLIVESGLPYLILRPSIVIGDSRNGHYFGPAYGVYQFWGSFRVLADRYRTTWHAVTTDHPLPMIHQDAFESIFLAAREKIEGDAFVNIVSPPELLPSLHDLWRLWCDRVARPHELRVYPTLDQAPLATLDPRMRAFLNFTAINTEIAGREWLFETRNRDRLIAGGARFPTVTIDTIAKCQARFVANSEIVRSYYEKFESQFPGAQKVRDFAERAEVD
jgi:nucleoside-diphosphate-sugar epimerase